VYFQQPGNRSSRPDPYRAAARPRTSLDGSYRRQVKSTSASAWVGSKAAARRSASPTSARSSAPGGKLALLTTLRASAQSQAR